MKESQFDEYIRRTRDCDAALLDAAVGWGLQRARSERLDLGKVIRFAAGCAAAVAVCLAMNLEPVKTAVAAINPGGRLMTDDSAQELYGYFGSFMETIINFGRLVK